MRTFKRPRKFGEMDSGRDSGRSSGRSFKKFNGESPRKFSNSSGRPKAFGSKESRSGNGFKLFEAVCDKCGNKCDLPFEPTGNKPIYCRSCFRESQGSNERFGQKNRFESKKFDDRQESNMPTISSGDLEAINRKLDKIMKALKIN